MELIVFSSIAKGIGLPPEQLRVLDTLSFTEIIRGSELSPIEWMKYKNSLTWMRTRISEIGRGSKKGATKKRVMK